MPNASTPAQYALILIDLVESLGHQRKTLLAGTGLAATGISGIGARVSEDDFITLVENAARITGDPALGLELGSRLNLSAHAILGQAFLTCRDLRQVMELFLNYYHLLAANLELQMDVDARQCRLVVLSTPEAPLQVFYYELLFGSILNTLRGLLNTTDVPLTVEAPYPAPPHSDRYRAVFGSSVQFDCPQGAVSFPAALLATPLPSSNPALKRLYEEECARLLADLAEEDSVAERTLRLLRKLEGK